MDHHLVIDDRTVSRVEIADTWARRARGMLGRGLLPDALLLRPCGSVHGTGMRVPLDVAFLNADGRVIDVVVLRPWAPPKGRRGAVAVLEAPDGSFDRWGLAEGSVVQALDASAPGDVRP